MMQLTISTCAGIHCAGFPPVKGATASMAPSASTAAVHPRRLTDGPSAGEAGFTASLSKVTIKNADGLADFSRM
jgi:hypothetical protein